MSWLDWMQTHLMLTALIGFGFDALLVAYLVIHAGRIVTRVWRADRWTTWVDWERSMVMRPELPVADADPKSEEAA